MKEMDIVRIKVEKNKYAKEGVHKGMYGWICLDDSYDGYWSVNFPQSGEKADIATLSIHEADMEIVSKLLVNENERIKTEWENKIIE